jgi:hypothetical protein
MKHLKTQIHFTFALGVLAVLAGVLGHLALSDIAHGEADVTLEWNIVRLAALVFAAFWGFALYTLRRVLRAFS